MRMKKLSKFDEKILKSKKTFSKRKRKMFVLSNLLFLMVLLSVNAFAWFIYISRANLKVSASIIGWDVNFFNGTTESDDFEIIVPEVYPGMTEFSKGVEIHNNSDLDGSFRYELSDIVLFGESVSLKNDISRNQLNDYFIEHYPFIVTTKFSNNVILRNTSETFFFNINWPYTSNNSYFKIDNFYKYNPNLTYYTFSNNTYNVAKVDQNNFDTLKNTLYLSKDDVDSFFGVECGKYKEKTGSTCLTVHMKLIVEQINKK